MKPSSILSLRIILLLSISFSPTYVYSVDDYEPYSNCALFSCGNMSSISYSFWGNRQPDYCGLPGFSIDCEEGISILDIMSFGKATRTILAAVFVV
ncbi:conserved hypothetical protein [Ricinus communis]|uniref:Wall-associated receptor kinase galacturonan-binding domain-containing protein n=1 Tax=Ricinus communis TaxID=3988 RepID=B9SFX9_RICCO|nr:conserved hypothetical protein [Ricinus communis]